MSDVPQKTQHDFNLAVVGAVKVIQSQIADAQQRLALLEETEQARSVASDLDAISDACRQLADALPEVPASDAAAPTAMAA